MPPRLSGLARQVLALHRDLLRAARTKDPEARVAFVEQIRAEFELHRGLDPRDVFSIEHHVRRGRKKLELLRSPSVTRAVRSVGGG
jgi:succinate dehydrogenase assembly factor 1